MKKLKELRENSNGQTRMLWHHNYWDVPLSGVMLWDGEKCWFNNCDEKTIRYEISEEELNEIVDYLMEKGERDENELREQFRYEFHTDYFYKVYKIPEDTLKKIEKSHELFRKYVGVHTDYDENGCKQREIAEGKKAKGKNCGHLRPYSEHKKFYNNKDKCDYKIDLDNWEMVGEFKL